MNCLPIHKQQRITVDPTQSFRRTSGVMYLVIAVAIALQMMVTVAFAELATEPDMRNVAANWTSEIINRHGEWAGSTIPQLQATHEIRYNGVLVGRYYDVEPIGYVVVPLLRDMSPVKMYSDESNLTSSQSGGVLDMIGEALYQRMEAFKTVYGSYDAVVTTTDKELFDPVHKGQWDRLAVTQKDFRVTQTLGTEASGGPLLTVSWDQGAPYNNDCPVGDGGTCVVGCVATASAQIMKYWEWPTTGIGNFYYTWEGDNSCGSSTPSQLLVAGLSDAYDWANMPDNCDGGCDATQAAALAELNYEVGVTLTMDYGVCGSGAWTGRAALIFPTFFKYKSSTHIENRNVYTRQEWFDLIRVEIDAGRPIQYRINLHSIVCDGYRDDGADLEFHMNYGWNEGHTAWYVLDNLYCSWVDGDICPFAEEYLIAGIEPQLEPVLGYGAAAFDDAVGNDNGMLEPGEDIEITVSVLNAGNDATGTTASLSTGDPYLTINTPEVTYSGAIGWGEQVASDQPFQVSIAPGCPDPHIAVIDVNYTADGGYVGNGSFQMLITTQPGFEDDVEAGEGFWTHTAIIPQYTDEWHLENARFHSNGQSWKMGGAGLANYGNNVDAALISPPLLLPVDAKLSFWHWMDAEADAVPMAWDGGAVYLSANGGAWEQVSPVGGYPNILLSNSSSSLGAGSACYSGQIAWNEAIFDLSTYSGVVQIMFRFGSDGGVNGEGWYVDDIWVGNTLVGTNVVVHPGVGVDLTFANVTERGITALTVSDTGPEPPSGYTAVPSDILEYREVTSNAVFDSPVDICLDYDPAAVVSSEDHIKLMHFNGLDWEDITSGLDVDNDRVCGQTTGFSPFLVVEKTGCCEGRVGDANMSGDDEPTIGDVQILIDMLFISQEAVSCLTEADVNQSGGLEPIPDDITIGDVTMLIDYLFITGPSEMSIPDCL